MLTRAADISSVEKKNLWKRLEKGAAQSMLSDH